jgi:trans-aconitate methyltransferase
MDKQLNTINIYNKHVQDYVNKFMDLQYKDTFDRFLELLPENATILELGCGPGNVVKYLTSKRSDLHILGIDLAPGMIEEAKKHNPGSVFKLMDIRKAGKIKEKFNAVIAAFCLPYIYDDVDAVFKNFNNLTHHNGLLYLSCMEGTKEESGFEKTSFSEEIYINYYEKKDIETRLKEQNFNIEAFYTKDYPETDGSVTTDLVYIAKKFPDAK